MNRVAIRVVVAAFGVGGVGSSALAQPFTLDWYTVDGGGGTSTGGLFEVSGTIGQPDAGVMSGGNFTLTGGFWVFGAGGGPAPCDPDVNCDGSPDQGDVACMILAIAGDLSCICQDPDFNLDGSADQGDVAAIIGVVAGQPCP